MRTRMLALLACLLAAAPSALAQQKGGDVVIGKYHSISSKVLGEERTFLIGVPEGYEKSTDKYPVLYVLDGSVRALVEGLQATTWAHGVPPMIVVAITNPNRERDLNPRADSDGPEKYLRFISEELFPYVEQRFRVQNHRTLYGASAGGLFVLYALLRQPDAFAAYIASSPTFFSPYYDALPVMATRASRPVPRRHTHLHIVYGDKEAPGIREALAKFLPVLEALRSDTLAITVRDLPEDGHVPNDGLARGLKQVFDGYRYPVERLEKEGLPALESHYEQLSRRLGFRVPVPEEYLERLGFLLVKNGKSADLKAVARALEQTRESEGLEHVLLVVAHFRANEIDLMKEHYRLAPPTLQRWAPYIPEWPKIVEAAKTGKSDRSGTRERTVLDYSPTILRHGAAWDGFVHRVSRFFQAKWAPLSPAIKTLFGTVVRSLGADPNPPAAASRTAATS